MKEILINLKSYKKELILGPLFKLLEAIIEISLPIIIAEIIDNNINFTPNQIIFYTIGMLIFILIGFGCASTVNILLQRLLKVMEQT